ncbi:MAG: type II secretion system protein GspN [Deltaproteobacteria bacterium]|nr:type II secretion system protein GspN [Deltaproteobacteria bacterium]
MKTWRRRLLVIGLHVLLFLVAMVGFLYLAFPWDRAARYAEAALAKKLDMDVRIGAIGPSWLTGLEFSDVTLRTRKPDRQGRLRTFHADRFVVRASIGSLFGGDLDLDIAADMMGGHVDGQIFRTKKDTRIVADLAEVSPNEISFLREMVGLPLKGRMTGRIDLTMRDHKFAKAAGTIEFAAKNVIVGDGKARLKLKVKPQYAELQEFLDREDQGVAIPPMKVGAFTLKLRVTRGSARVVQLGASSEHIEIKGEGDVRLADPVTASESRIYIMYKFSDAYENLDSETRSMLENMRSSPNYRRALRSDGYFGFCLAGVLRDRIRPLPSRDGCPDRPPAEPVIPAVPGGPPTPPAEGPAPPPPTIVTPEPAARLEAQPRDLVGA